MDIMKNRYLVYFILGGIILGLFTSSFIHTVHAETYVTFGFEGMTIGLHNVSNDDVSVQIIQQGSNRAEVDTTPYHSGEKSYKSNHAEEDFYVNFTKRPYGRVSFWFRLNTNQNDQFTVKMYNSDDVEIIRFLTPSSNALQIIDHEGTTQQIGSTSTATWTQVQLTFNASDNVYCQVQGSSYKNSTQTPYNIDYDNYNISYMIFDNIGNADLQLDDIVGVQDFYRGTSDNFYFNQLTVHPTVFTVGELVDVDISITGTACATGEYFMSTTNDGLNPCMFYHSFQMPCGDDISGIHTKDFNENFMLSSNFGSGTYYLILFKTASNGAELIFSVPIEVINTLGDYYYNLYYHADIGLFAEFKTLNNFNLYDPIEIVYYLPCPAGCYNFIDCGYVYNIALYHNNELIDYFTMYGRNMTVFDHDSLGTFEYDGRYQLKVFNITGKTHAEFWTDLEYESEIITIGDYDVPYDDLTDSEKEEIASNNLIGIGIIILVGLGIAILLGHIAGFFVGAIFSTIALSHETMGMYQLLDPNLGIWLIVGMVIFAVILIIINK